jgi:hypothetical protein
MKMKKYILDDKKINICSKYKNVFYYVRNIGICIIETFIILDIKRYSFYWYIYSSLFNKPTIHAIGDSHTKAFKKVKFFIVHHIGPATAYNLNKDISSTNSKKKMFAIINKLNREKDIIMLVFGEIDCRIHIYNQYKKSKGKFTIEMLIEDTISNYGQVLEQLNLMDIKFFVLGIPPASRQENIYDYPFYASSKMRSKINMEFNNRIKEYCTDMGIRYMDIYSKVSDENGFILAEYAADDVHLNAKVGTFVRTWLEKEMGIEL